jgi:hypothetical protein
VFDAWRRAREIEKAHITETQKTDSRGFVANQW